MRERVENAKLPEVHMSLLISERKNTKKINRKEFFVSLIYTQVK
jgi:hypothetical protein